MKLIHLRLIKRVLLVLAIVPAALFFIQNASGADNIYVVKSFLFDKKNIDVVKDSMMADEYDLYFESISNKGKKLYYKIQLTNGACDIGDTAPEALRPGAAKSCVTAGLSEKVYGAFHKNMVCDGKILFSIPLDINKKKYHAVIASDWHLYIFSCQALFRGRSFPVYRTPIGARPIGAAYSAGNIFVLTSKSIAGFRVSDSIKERENKILAPSSANTNAADSIKASLITADGVINDFECASKFATFEGSVLKKMIVSKNKNIAAGDYFVYLLMGQGEGNINIFGMNYDFNLIKLSNFSGAIFDFRLLDPKPPLFLISHTADVLLKDISRFNSWTFSPPDKLGAAPKNMNPVTYDGSETEPAAVFSKNKTSDGRYLKISMTAGGEALLESLDAEGGDSKKITGFSVHRNIMKGNFAPSAALSSDAKMPAAFFYDSAGKTFHIYDIMQKQEHDSFYHNFNSGVISGTKFSFDNNIVLFKVLYYEEGSSKVQSSALYAYRVVNKTLTQIAAHRTIGDFDCIRHETKHKVILIYSQDKQYCDSISFLSID